MTKKNAFQTQRAELLQKAFQENPLLSKAKKFILVTLIIWLGIRIIDIIASVILTLVLDRGIVALLLCILPYVLILFIAAAIYTGYRLFIWLPILGALQMIAMFILNFENIVMASASGDTLYLSVSLLTVTGALIQTIIMMILLLNKNCKAYFKTVDTIAHDIGKLKKAQ